MHAVETQRYVITDGDGDETYCTQVHDIRGDGMIGPNFSEAESEIIAFALTPWRRATRCTGDTPQTRS